VDAGSGVLLPLSRASWTVTANPASTGGNAPANAIDGDLGTRYSSATAEVPGFDYQVNLGSQQTLTQLTVDSSGAFANDATVSYTVEVSNDGTTWSNPVATGTGGTPLLTIPFGPVSAQYVRLNQTGTQAMNNWWSIDEVNLWAPQPLVQTPVSGTHTPLVRTAWVASSFPTNAGDPPASAIDGVATTRFSTGEFQSPWQYFQVNLGSQQTFSQATLDATGSNNDYPRAFEITVSNDGTTWSAPVAIVQGTTTLITVQFPAQTAQYVRVSLLDIWSMNYWSMTEFNLLQ
jgi:hypothetical protein